MNEEQRKFLSDSARDLGYDDVADWYTYQDCDRPESYWDFLYQHSQQYGLPTWGSLDNKPKPQKPRKQKPKTKKSSVKT